MNLRLIGLGTGAVVFASTLSACGALQQDPQCVVAKGSFATVYTPKPGQSTSCAPLKPEAVGLEKYFSEDPNAKDTVAVRVQRVGTMMLNAAKTPPTVVLDPDAPNAPNSLGALTDVPGEDNFCEVPTLNATRLVARTPALSLSYEWSNLRVYNTPGIPGTQFTADLRYTENDCPTEYTVKGIWPLVSCATGGKPDDTKCDPYPDPAAGRHRGSGINPIFPVKCDPDVKICVLTGDVPSDKP
jgi:hypothetical protein